MIKNLFHISLIVFLYSCTICRETKCKIDNTTLELISFSDSKDGVAYQSLQSWNPDMQLGLLIGLTTYCKDAMSCKPGYGGVQDSIIAIKVLLKTKGLKNVDVSNQLITAKRTDRQNNQRDQYASVYYPNDIYDLELFLNSTLNARFDKTRSNYFDTGYDLNDIGFPLLLHTTLIKRINNGDQLLLNVQLSNNEILTDTIYIKL